MRGRENDELDRGDKIGGTSPKAQCMAGAVVEITGTEFGDLDQVPAMLHCALTLHLYKETSPGSEQKHCRRVTASPITLIRTSFERTEDEKEIKTQYQVDPPLNRFGRCIT